MLCTAVENYISTAKGLPFFYVVGDDEYSSTLEDLVQRGLKVIRTSDFCSKDDKFPDVDEMVDYFRTADVDYRDNKYVLVGLGEYLALRGTDEASAQLRRLKATTLGNARVVLLLRGISSQAKALISDDARLSAQGRACYSSSVMSNLSAVNIVQDIGIVEQKGIRHLLRTFEDGGCHDCKFSSALSYEQSQIRISRIEGAYAALRYMLKEFSLPETLGTKDQWTALLSALKKNGNSLILLFEKYGVADSFETDFYEKISGLEFKNWLYFISLKVNIDVIQNGYLAYVIKNTDDFTEFKNNILTCITAIPHEDRRFMKFYNERKKLVRNLPESDVAVFVNANSIDPKEEVYRLTDNTLLEKRSIIKWIAKHGWDTSISYVYPALTTYLRKYIFDCGSLSGVLTDYFEKYKIQKVENRIEESFLQLVDQYGSDLRYTKLQTRDNAIKSIDGKETAFVYWIDARGVEYLSYFAELARQKGLSMHVEIARADLPTITSINRSFFDNWTGKDKYKEESLDDVKHHEKGGYFFTDCEEPIHIASELSVIENAVEFAATQLAMHKCKTFVIASDHGASRLAVLRKKEEKYPTDTKGEHSGRCCKVFDDCDLQNKVEENGYFVLTDYGRFQGSRAANVEVHGGAALEEVVVPVITLKLKKQSDITIRVLNWDNLQADKKAGTIIQLYISDVEHTNHISVVINGVKYLAECEDSTHYRVVLHDIKRSKTCSADLYDGDDLIGSVALTIKGKSGSIDKSFDAEFEGFDF